MGIIVVFIGCALFVFILSLTVDHKKEEERLEMPYSKGNVLFIYTYLAGWIMKKNVRNSRDKMQFIHLYFKRHFKRGYSVSYEKTDALRNEFDVEWAIGWLNRKMKDPSEKQQLLEFLITLSMEDGAITQAEFDAIVWFGKGIGFTQVELEQWIQTKKDQHYRQQQSQQAPPVIRTVTKKQEAMKILGADASISLVELKKLYRNLVKLYHPDTLINPSETEKSEA
ncbi:MAG: hypothetical protein HYZ43_01090, partial [Flavobacteriia bacterium]|nr:hypothetical protein [Flavobacteriia bacterium]